MDSTGAKISKSVYTYEDSKDALAAGDTAALRNVQTWKMENISGTDTATYVKSDTAYLGEKTEENVDTVTTYKVPVAPATTGAVKDVTTYSYASNKTAATAKDIYALVKTVTVKDGVTRSENNFAGIKGEENIDYSYSMDSTSAKRGLFFPSLERCEHRPTPSKKLGSRVF